MGCRKGFGVFGISYFFGRGDFRQSGSDIYWSFIAKNFDSRAFFPFRRMMVRTGSHTVAVMTGQLRHIDRRIAWRERLFQRSEINNCFVAAAADKFVAKAAAVAAMVRPGSKMMVYPAADSYSDA